MEYGKFKLTDETKKQLNQQSEAAAARGARANAAVEQSKGNTAAATKWTNTANDIDAKTGIKTDQKSAASQYRQYVTTGNEAIDLRNELRIRAGLDPVYVNALDKRNQMRLDAGLKPSVDITPQMKQVWDTQQAYTNYLADQDIKISDINKKLEDYYRMQDSLMDRVNKYSDASAYYEMEANGKEIDKLRKELDRIEAGKTFASENQTLFNVTMNGDLDLFQNYTNARNLYNTFPVSAAGDDDKTEYYKEKSQRYNRMDDLYNQIAKKGYTDQQIMQVLNVLDTQAANELTEEAQKLASANPLAGAAMSVVSVLTAPARGLTGVMGMIADPGVRNSPFYAANQLAETVQSTVRQDIETNVKSFVTNILPDGKATDKAATALGKATGFVYSAGVASIESLLAMNLGGPFGEVLMGLGAATSTYNEGLNNGMSSYQALQNAVAAGAFETIFEHLSLENLRALQAGTGKGLRTTIVNTLKSFLTEGSEEVFTDVANELFDYFRNGGLSAYERAVEAYMEAGMSRNEAEKKYKQDFLKQLGESMVVGGLSGAMHGTYYGGKTLVSNQINSRINNAAMNYATGANVRSMAANQGVSTAEVAKGLTAQVQEGGKAAKALSKLSTETETKQNAVQWLASVGTTVRTGKAVSAALNELSETQRSVMIDALLEDGTLSKKEATQVLDSYNRMQNDTASADDMMRVISNTDRIENMLTEIDASRTAAQAFLKAMADNAVRMNVERVTKAAEKTFGKRKIRDAKAAAERSDAVKEAIKTGTTEELKVPTYAATATDVGDVQLGAIKSVEDGKVQVIADESGATVDLNDVAFSDTTDGEKAATIYNTLRDMMTGAGEYRTVMSVEGANAALAMLQGSTLDAGTFLRQFYDAYQAGTVGRNIETFMFDTDYDLSNEELAAAYSAGAKEYKVKPGITRIGTKELTGRQKREVEVLEPMLEKLGVKLILVDSLVSKSGEVWGEAYGSTEGDVIVLALESIGRENLISVTGYHELFHWMGKIDPQGQKALIKSVVETLKKTEGVDYKAIYDQKAKVYKGATQAKIEEEIACQYLGTILASNQARIAAAQAGGSVWQKALAHLKEWFSNIKQEIKTKFASDMAVQAALMQDAETAEKQVDAFIEMLEGIESKTSSEFGVRSSELNETENLSMAYEVSEGEEIIGEDAVYNSEGDFVAPLYSLATYEGSDYVQNRDKMVEKIMQKVQVDEDTARTWLNSIDSIAAMIANNKDALDYDQTYDEGKTALKKNSEYRYTLDFSTLCAKRLLFTGTFNEIQKALPKHAFTSEELVELRKMMQDRGYQVACGICYVESTRREMGPITEEFIERYEEAQRTGEPIKRINSEGEEVTLRRKVKKGVYEDLYTEDGYTPTLGDLNTTDIDNVRIEHPDVYDAYLAFMNARGQAKPKLLETRTDYKGEILRTFADKRTVNARNRAGGLRVQSFSDFEIVHLIDMMQVVMDMSVVGLRSQAYTKVPAFAEAMGNTGMKINLSLIAKGTGLDKNGNLIFDRVEGMDEREAFRLREKFSENVGTILVGVNDAHILAAMADPRIDFIIPFHKSSWRADLYEQLGIRGYEDYTETQNEKWLNKDGEESKRKCKNLDPSSYWRSDLTGDENAQIYLEKCEREGRRPKFPQFAYDEQGNVRKGYWKLLIDFKMYDNDGNYAEQKTVKPIFDDAVTMRMMDDYAKTSPGAHNTFPVAQDVVKDFVKTTRSREMGRQIAGLTQGVKTSWSLVDDEYMKAVDEGDEEAQARLVEEAAKKAGYTIKAYHGTDSKFTVFNKNMIGKNAGFGDGPGFYFTTAKTSKNETSADTYGSNIIDAYLKINNPLSNRKKTVEKNEFTSIFHSMESDKGTWHKYVFEDLWDNANSDYELYSAFTNRTMGMFRINETDVINGFAEMGYDGVIVNLNNSANDTHYVVFSPEQIKSADPVTYDDEGNVIPLSERFNPEENDIRYSLVEDAEAAELEQRLRYSDERTGQALDILSSIVENSVGTADRRLTKNAYYRLADKYLLTREGKNDSLSREQTTDFAKKLERIDSMLTTAENMDSAIFYELYQMLREDAMEAGYYEAEDWVKEFRKEFRDNGKQVTLYIPENVRTEVIDALGGPNSYRKELRNKFKITFTEGEGTDLSVFYNNLRDKEQYAGLPETDQPSVMIENMLALYTADDKRWHDTSKDRATAAEYDGMSLEEVTADRALTLMTEIVMEGRKLSKNARMDLKYLKEIQKNMSDERKADIEKVNQRMEAAMNQELRRLMTDKKLDSVQYEIETEKIRNRYRLEGVRSNYERQLDIIEDQNAVLNAQRDEGVRQIRAEYETRYEKQKERYNEQIKKQKEYYDQKLDDQWNKQKEYWKQKNDERAKYLRDMYQERLLKQRRGYEDTLQKQALRRQIKQDMKAVSDVFLNNKKNKWLPPEMQADVMDFLLFFENDRNVFTGRQMEKLLKISTMLEDERLNNSINIFGGFDETLSQKVMKLVNEVNTQEEKRKGRITHTGLMTVQQLEELKTIIKEVRYLIETTNEVEVNGWRVKLSEKGDKGVAECAEEQKKHPRHLLKNTFFDDFMNNKMLTPIYMFNEKIGGVFGEFYEDIRNAQDKNVWLGNDAQQFMQNLRKKYDTESWKAKNDENVKQFHYEATLSRDEWNPKLDVETRMSIYALYKRQAMNGMESEHLNKGGIIISDESLGKKKLQKIAEEFKNSKATEKGTKKRMEAALSKLEQDANRSRHMLFYDELQQIADSLTAEQKAYVDEVVKFLSTTCAEWGNETSQKLTGIKKFTETYYFPFHSAKSYMRTQFGVTDDSQLKNMGFTKEAQRGANSPLMITPFTQTAVDHIEQMARYASFAVPIDNLQRLFNYQPVAEEGVINPDNTVEHIKVKLKDNMHTALLNAYGQGTVDYIKAFVTDLNGGIKPDKVDSLWNKGISTFKRAAVMANLSVIVQQPTAEMRAMAMINPVYFVGFKTTDSNWKEFLKADYLDMMEHSAVAILKTIGSFDTDTGRSMAEWIMDDRSFEQKVTDFLGKGAELADIVTWTNIWNAVKRETKHQYKNLEYGSDAFYEIVEKRFRDVIDYTQVYDSTLSKSQLMRAKGSLSKMVTSFMAEPTLSYNLLTQSGMKRNGRKINKGRAMCAFFFNMLVNSAFKTFIGAAFRDKDDDEAFIERWTRRFMAEMFGSWKVNRGGVELPMFFLDSSLSPLTMIPVIKDIVSLWGGFDIDRADVSVINDVMDTIAKLVKNIRQEDGRWALNTKEGYLALGEFVAMLSNLTTVPLGRLTKDVMGATEIFINEYNRRFHVTGQTLLRAINEGLGFELSDAEKAYNAVLNNDQETIDRMLHVTKEKLKKVEGKGYTGEKIQKEADVEMEKKYISLLAEGLAAFDPEQRVQAAAQARADRNYDLYDELVEDMVNDGFSLNAVLTATESAWKALNAEEPEVQEIKDRTAYSYTDMKAAVDANDLKGFEHVMTELKKQGKVESDIREEAREYIGKQLGKGAYDEQTAVVLYQRFGGLNEETARKKAGYNSYKGSNENTAMYDSAWDSYTRITKNATMTPQEAGIDPEDYANYYKAKNAVKGKDEDGDGETDKNSVKKQILPLIDALPISNEAKDQLYLMEWAEYDRGKNGISLKDAPWHK